MSVPDAVALEWAIHQLEHWLAGGLEPGTYWSAERPPAPPGGGHGGRRVATADTPKEALPSKNGATPPMGSGAEGVSDGLTPPGEQLTLPLA